MVLTEKLVEEIWEKEKLPETVRQHCSVVLDSSMVVAKRVIERGVKVDLELVKYGALLHDIGRSKDHSARQGITGYEILGKYSEIPEEVKRIVKFHVGAGLTKEDCTKLKISPAQDLLPITVEEKIVSYGDNLVGALKIRTFEETLADFQKKYGNESATRLKLQHEELENFVTRDEMHALEVKAVQRGATIEQLMEKAGKGVAEITNSLFPVNRKKVVCFIGPGNNGGDASVAARYFKNMGANVLAVVLADQKTLEAKLNFKRLKNAGVEAKEIKTAADLKATSGDIAIDGIFGTGMKGDLSEPYISAIKEISEFEIKVSIDVPSAQLAKPDLVVCLGRIKKELVGKFSLGRIQIADIGL